jgi:4-hydroxy-3-methylbut-2-enyl diphosphate reductase IspH
LSAFGPIFYRTGRAVHTEVLAIMGDNITQTAGIRTAFGLRLGFFVILSHGRLRVFVRQQTKFKSANLSIINQLLTHQIINKNLLIQKSYQLCYARELLNTE